MKVASRAFLQTSLSLGLAASRTVSAELASNKCTLNPLRGLQPFAYSSTSTANMTHLAPVISISHGGGPMPILGDPSHAAITHSLKTRVPQILKLGTPEQPRAIVLVTAHWSTNKATISSGKKHELYYDYSGFPAEAYSLRYDAPGSPEVAEMVRRALEEGGVGSEKDGTRGMPHFLMKCTSSTR
jgi:hypothetical protein